MGDGEDDDNENGNAGGAGASGSYGSAMKKWVDRLETIRYENDSNENISK